jgi:hypothetical protein
MRVTGLHLLWSYKCIYECDHCFAWGSPRQDGTFTLHLLDELFAQADDLGSIEWFYFEGGEPLLYYATLLRAVQRASERGYKCGMVTNAYWATDEDDAIETLRPFEGLIDDLSISSDLYHSDRVMDANIRNAVGAAAKLRIPVGTITIAQPEMDGPGVKGQLPNGEIGVMYRGRAAEKLIDRARRQPWDSFSECPHEDLRKPERLHIDSLGHVHLCQGLSIGNLLTTSLKTICQTFDPEAHPVIGPLLAGGPAAIVRRFGLAHDEGYVDACHLCYEARRTLRGRFPSVLAPDQMYGVAKDD